ncbi:MAG: F0F1 ATP synthase subunit A [Proteobacteria bacterium]|nr:F0F1 ATP synthase subunit A [Pseudomonadota bacterium]
MSADSHAKHSPLDQFKLQKISDSNLELAGFDVGFTNSALYMVLATAVAIIFMLYATRKKSTKPDRLQIVAESVYSFVFNMVESSIGKEGLKFFPLVFCLFIFILLCNVLGITPYSFTATSHITITFGLAMIAFTTVTIFAIARNGLFGFFHMFLPSGVPWWMAPVIFLIEFFSFLIRPITLSVRLFANMVAGHVLLKVVAGFIISLGIIFGVAPMLFAVIMTGFELFVAVLQSYIFAILVCAYLGEVTRAH